VCRTTVGIFKSYCNKNYFFNLHIINMHLALFTQRRGSNQTKMFPTKFENFRSSFILFGSFGGQILKYFMLCPYSILIIPNNFQVFVMFRWWHSSFKCNIIFCLLEFASQNLLAERQRQQCDSTSGNIVWPVVHVMDDSCVMWQNLTVDNSMCINVVKLDLL
jgi:hypothetical protein